MMTITYHPSFLKVKEQLQITLPPAEYQAIIDADEIGRNFQRLPYHTFARCPFCGAPFQGYVDTHSLYKWGTSVESYQDVYRELYEDKGCEHFTGVQKFINLNGHLPMQTTHFANQCGDIPIMLPELFFDDMNTWAVMHSLAICRLEHQTFIPSYSLYLLTYYTDHPKEARRRAMAALYPPDPDSEQYHWPTLWSSSERIQVDPKVADLKFWVEQGRLSWLDLDSPDLPLTSAPVNEFPYAAIQGFGCGYTYWKRPKPRWWWQQKHWKAEGEFIDFIGRHLI